MSEIAIEINNLSKTFRGKRKEIRALENVSLTIFKNEIFGLLGPNGSGKTTLLRILCTLIPPDKESGGYTILKNNVVIERKKVRYEIGYVPQQGALYTDLNPLDNMIFLGFPHFSTKKEVIKRAEDLLKKANLYDRKKDLVSTFSGGMLQKLSIICSLLHSPDIIFLDEITVGLDIQTKEGIWNLIKELKKNKTVVLATHDMEEAEELCDRVAILNKGRILEVGPVLDLKNKYKTSNLKDVVKKLTYENK